MVSVIIVNYNTAQYVSRCIQSVIRHTTDLEYELILVDNQSPQRDIEEVVSSFPGIVFIQQGHNAGFGQACQTAVQHAKGQFYFFLNPDAELDNNALKYFRDFWEEYDQQLDIACLGAQLQDFNGQKIHSGGSFPRMGTSIRYKLCSLVSRLSSSRFSIPFPVLGEQGTYLPVDYVTGADLFISKENYERSGGFDPQFFLYFEETDLQLQLKKMGKQAYLVPGALIRHQQGGSMEKDKNVMKALYHRSMLRYFRKYNDPLLFFLFKCAWHIIDFKQFVNEARISKHLRN